VEQVLIGVSFAAEDDCVVESGLVIARAIGARAHLLHCVRPPLLGVIQPDFDEFVAQKRAALESLVERAGGGDDPTVTLEVKIDTPYRGLGRAEKRLGADLVVVGAVDKPGHRFGSTAERVIRKATCPILVVRETVKLPLRRVLAPVDLSTLSADSFRCGLSFLDQLRQKEAPEIEVLFVLNEVQRRFGGQLSAEQVDRFVLQELHEFVEGNCTDLSRWTVHETMRIGEEREQILGLVEASQPNLVLIGTHGRGGVERVLIGSVTANIVRKADANVLVVPPEVAFGAEIVDAVVEQTKPSFSVPKQPRKS